MIPQRIVFLSLILASLAVLAGCGGGATSAPATSVPAATSTPAPPPATPVPAAPATPAPAATPTPVTESVTFEFVNELATLEELEDMALELEEVEGIKGISGNEVSITIRYDPELLTVEELRTTMAQKGRAVKE